jgi:hypothetical protein
MTGEPRRLHRVPMAPRLGSVAADRIFNETMRAQARAIRAAEDAADALAALAPFCDTQPELAERITRQSADLKATARVLRSAP